MRFAVLAALVVLLAAALWLGGDSTESALEEPRTDPSAQGPGLGVRAKKPPTATKTARASLEVHVRLHARPARADVTLRHVEERDQQALEMGVLDVHELPAIASRTALDDGTARFDELAPGAYHVTAHAADGGHATLLTQLGAGAGTQEVILDLLSGVHRFDGRLVDGAQPASGWRVRLGFAQDWDSSEAYDNVDPLWSTTADADGRFAFRDLPHGRYVVTARQSGRTSIAFNSILIPAAGEHVFDVGSRETPVEGVVKDRDTDAPIAGATVRVYSQSQGWSRCDTLRTDAQGRFAAVVGSWSDVVRVAAPGYAPRDVSGRNLEDAGPFVIHLARLGRVEGSVVAAASGAPIAGASVCLLRWTNSVADARWAESDAQGRFAFGDVPPGEVRVFVLGGGQRSAVFDVATRRADPSTCLVRPGETTVLTLAARPTLTLRGRVFDAQGAPVGGARIVPAPFFEIRDLSVFHRMPLVHSDAGGRFELVDLVPGSSFDVAVWIDGRPQGGTRVSADPGTPEPIEIRLEPLRRFLVEVLDATTAKPIAGAVVLVDDERGVYAGRPWLTDASGRVTFEVTDSHLALESVHAAGYVAGTGLGGTLHPLTGASADHQPSVTFRLDRGEEIAGRVHLLPGVPPAAVTLTLEIDSDDERDGDVLYGVLDVHGRFTLRGVVPGTHKLEAVSWWKGRSHHAALEVEAGARDVEVHLEPEEDDRMLPLRVRVRDERGRLLVRGIAFLLTTGRKGVPRRYMELVHDGEARFRNSGAAPRWLVVTPTHDASGLKPNLVPSLIGPFDRDQRHIDVVLRSGRTIRGRVTDAAGRPVPGVQLHVTVDWRIGAFPRAMPIYVCEAHSDADGRFALAGLPDEAVKVDLLDLPLGWVRPPRIELGVDAATLDIELEPAARAAIRVVDWRDQPVPRARVRWVPRRENYKDKDVAVRLTDARGRVEFGHLRPDEPVDLIVVPPDERRDCLTFRLEPAPLEDRVVRLARGYALEATVLDSAGHPVAGAMIWRSANGVDGWTAQGRTDKRGVQILHGIPAGGITLRAQRRSRAGEGAPVQVAAEAGSCSLRVPD